MQAYLETEKKKGDGNVRRNDTRVLVAKILFLILFPPGKSRSRNASTLVLMIEGLIALVP
jgi:hypothetical protein